MANDKYGKNFGSRDNKPYGERRSYGDRDRKTYRDRDNKSSYGERTSYGDRNNKPYGDRDRKPYGDRDRKPYGDSNRTPYGDRDRKPYGDSNRKPYGDREKKPYLERDNKSYGERKGYGDRDRKPYGDSNRKPYGEKKYRDGECFEHKDELFASRLGAEFDSADESIKNGNAGGEESELPNIIMGRNPVKEAIKSGKSIDRILVTKEHDGSLGEIITLAHEANLVIREVDRRKLDEICMPFGHNGKSGNHQGILAEIPGVEYAELSDILEYAESRGEKPFIILLDGIEDPHNLGSIIRSAECAGAHGVVITKRRSASVTAAVVKTSAGAAEHMRIARVVNLANTIDTLKERGIWIAGADMNGKAMYDVDMKGAFALVIGSEGSGLSKLVKEKCDFLVSIPLKGNIDSLNAAVAGAIIMFEKNRQEKAE
ncbi:MAG: 23S rRNA (guanosine(2251)-2'-O)-methyltransferase RlmB [Eubacteriales bacterium]|nr:23S rRNA (guanosine(2251)-2'-O)-methyltransferase RlmB [Eubacteriales bacterium]